MSPLRGRGRRQGGEGCRFGLVPAAAAGTRVESGPLIRSPRSSSWHHLLPREKSTRSRPRGGAEGGAHGFEPLLLRGPHAAADGAAVHHEVMAVDEGAVVGGEEDGS